MISGGRLQLGISRGSPEQVIDGWRHFGYVPQEGENESDMARRHTEVLLEVLREKGLRNQTCNRCSRTRRVCCASSLIPKGLRDRIWWGAGSNATAVWAAKLGMKPAKLNAERR